MAERTVEEVIERCVSDMGYTGGLKPDQRRAVLLFLQHKDVFVSLPTGFGKSLCYGCLPLVFDCVYKKEGSIVLVISPLIALMKDQVRQVDLKKALNVLH
jgi:superfamily II DNA helicase RecQ